MNTRTKAQNQRPGFSTADHWLRGGQVVGHTWDMTVEVNAMSHGQILLADRAYDSDALRSQLLARGIRPVIPNAPYRKRLHPFDAEAYKRRNLVERAFCRLKGFRRIATRYDKLACTYAAAIYLAAIVVWWL